MDSLARALFASAVLFATTATASAADYTPTPAYAPSWTGFYIGGQIGGGAVVHEVDLPASGPVINFNGVGGEGFLGGAVAGFNYQIGPRFVIGAQADFSWTDISTDASLNLGILNADATVKASWLLSASGRIGYLVNDDALLYVIGGYTTARFKASVDVAGLGGDSLRQDFDGFHVGGGLEARITDSVTLRAEYRYFQFDEEEFAAGAVGIAPSMHVGTIGLAWNFGWPGGDSHATPAADYAPAPVAAGWSGLYFGGFVGGGAVVHDIDVPASGPIFEFNGVGGEGALGGPMVGLNYQLGNFVVGAQFDAAFTGIETEASLSVPPFLSAGAKVKLDHMLSASARLGYLINPDTLAYVIGGYTHGRFSAEASFVVPQVVNLSASDKKSFDGFHVGGGLEAKLTDTLTARAEYRYTQFKEEDLLGGFIGVSPSIHTGTVGLAWTFFSL